MDLPEMIQQLTLQKLQVERAIAQLEELQNTSGANRGLLMKRRGRRSMGPEERQAVSLRMKAHWARRRQGQQS